VVVLSLLEPAWPDSPQQTEEQRKTLCRVEGRVISAADGTSLKSARVVLMPQQRQQAKDPLGTMSDANGHFVLNNVLPGRYEFLAIHSGYVTQHFKPDNGPEKGAILTLGPGQELDNVLFRMTRAAVISGRVLNEEGEPIVGVPVRAERRETEDEFEGEDSVLARRPELSLERATITDDRGEYRLFGLPPNEYYVQVGGLAEPDRTGYDRSDYWIQQSLGSEYGTTYYPGVSQVTQAQVVPLKPGDEVQADIAVHRVKTVEVSGRVRGLSGPVKHAWVGLESTEDDSYSSSYQDNADENGVFRIMGVPSGSYVLRVYQGDDGGFGGGLRARQKLDVADTNVEGLDLVLGAGANLSGRVIASNPGEQLDFDRMGVMLISTDADNSDTRQARVKKDGTFEMKGVPDGRYALRVWNLAAAWYLKSARSGTEDILDKGLNVEKGSTGGRIEIVMSTSCAHLEGAVVRGDNPQPGAEVRITPDPKTRFNRFRTRSATTDQAGRFSVSDLAPGKYLVVAKISAGAESDSLKSDPQSVTLVERDRKGLELKVLAPQSN
jgi:hypothetical protein